MPPVQKHQAVLRCESLRKKIKDDQQFFERDRKGVSGWRLDNVLRGKLLAKAAAAVPKGSKQASSLAEAGQWLTKFDTSCGLNQANSALVLKELGKLDAGLDKFLSPAGAGGRSPSLPRPEDVKEGQALVSACEEFFKKAEASRTRLRTAAVACFDRMMATEAAKSVEWGKLGKLA